MHTSKEAVVEIWSLSFVSNDAMVFALSSSLTCVHVCLCVCLRVGVHFAYRAFGTYTNLSLFSLDHGYNTCTQACLQISPPTRLLPRQKRLCPSPADLPWPRDLIPICLSSPSTLPSLPQSASVHPRVSWFGKSYPLVIPFGLVRARSTVDLSLPHLYESCLKASSLGIQRRIFHV